MLKDCNNKKAMSLCKGKESLLIPYTDALLSIIFELRETGMPVSTTMVIMKGAQICHEFHEETREAQVSITKWFVKVHGMVHQIGTHLSQQAPGETQGEALDLIITTHPKLTGPEQHQDYIINVDQTPVPFTYNAKSTLDVVGV